MKLYTAFHLNLAYSSIEEERRAEVIERCYWPLLRLAREASLPIGVEATASTLEAAAAIDPAWVAELRRLIHDNLVEFVGSGSRQIIGPLVPAEVNAANLLRGQEAYESILGLRPTVALVNEQAYSAGLLPLYRAAGYDAIIMEWDNPFHTHPAWKLGWKYKPQRIVGQHGEELSLVWSHSIAFQKFQRYVHDDITLEEYLEYLGSHRGEAFPLYTNDVEVFGFRPGRFHTEAALLHDEWERIRLLVKRLREDSRFEFTTPSGVLALLDAPGAGQRLSLESAEAPIPVKKQGKYNVTRWAVTGPDDLALNTRCWRVHAAIRDRPWTDPAWGRLLAMWASDLRTHITEKRLTNAARALTQLTEDVGAAREAPWPALREATDPSLVPEMGRFVTVATDKARIRLNARRGLAIDRLWLGDLDGPFLCGTLPIGHYEDMAVGADWYSGHVVFEGAGQPKVTDLGPVEPRVLADAEGNPVVEAVVRTALGEIDKRVTVDRREPRIVLEYRFRWANVPAGCLRLGHLTMNPAAFDPATLFYACRNGGPVDERFSLAGTVVDHGSPVSFLVSAREALGLTDGTVVVGDAQRRLRAEVDKTASALIGLVTHRPVRDSTFTRLSFSAQEMDEARIARIAGAEPLVARITLRA